MKPRPAPYLIHHLLEVSSATLEKEAIIDGDRRFSYADLTSATTCCAQVLHAKGLARGDRVAILLPKSFEECWAIFGASQAGGVFVPLNTLLRPQQIRHILEDCGARFLVTNQRFLESLGDSLSDMACLEHILLSDGDFEEESGPYDETGTIGEDLAAILYTSGSTGKPKGVMVSHRNLLAGARIVSTYLDITDEDRLLSILPFSFDYGLNQLLTTVREGAALVLLNFHFGNEIVRALVDEKITGLAGVPTVWALLTKAAPHLARADLDHLRFITNSGGAVPSETVSRLRELLPRTEIFLMYGLTEAFRSTYLPPNELDQRPTSMGKAIPESEVFLVNEQGTRCLPGQPGVLVHRGPTVSMGYWNRPDDTAKVLRPDPRCPLTKGGDIVCYSGDLAVEDEDGFLYFVGRDDAMIKSAGYRISPTEVEEALMSSGCFEQVAVIGLTDPNAGQLVHAIGIARLPDSDVNKALEHCADLLPNYMVPRTIELVDTLPRSPNGKVDYKELRRERENLAKEVEA